LKNSPNSEEKINSTDLQIIKSIKKNPRQSMRKLAHSLSLTQSLLKKHLKNLENTGVIRGYIPLIDSTKMGYAVTAIIFIQIEAEHMVEVENEIAQQNNVLSVYEITGEYDAIVLAKFRDNTSLNVFLKSLLVDRFIKRTTTLIAMNPVKEYSTII
jgi:Lrp/AsnC family transcriptional regulator, regulator for asnA, asnC and gidA